MGQYGFLPGDYPYASNSFANCTAAAGDGGNGDGLIGVSSQFAVANCQGTYNSNESLRVWQHLSLAGMINGTYSGFGASSANTGVLGVNTPPSTPQLWGIIKI